MKNISIWKRLGSLLLALILVMSLLPATHTHVHAADISGGTKLFLTPGPWNVDGARYAIYVFDGGGGNAWASLTDSDSDGVYEVTVPAGTWTSVIFCRMNGGTTANNWDNRWNQTADLTFDGTNNHYTVTGWNAGDGTWSHAHVWNAEEGTCFCGVECDHFDADIVEENPTCVSIGRLYNTCRTCGYEWTSPGGDPEPENDAAHVWKKTAGGTKDACQVTYTCELDGSHTKTVPFTAHSFTDSVCTNCGYGCDHIAAVVDSVCAVCGWECDHPAWVESGGYATCRYCGIDAVAKVVDTYYLDVEEALTKAQETDGCTLTLFQNVSGLTEALTISKGNFTLEGMSRTISGTIEGPVLKITGGTVILKSVKVENPSTVAGSRAIEITGGDVTVRGGTINAGRSGIFIPLDSNPTVTLVGGTITAERGVDNNSTASTLNLGTDAEAGPTIQSTTYGVSSRGKVVFNSGSVSGEFGFYLTPGAEVTLYAENYPINATTAHFFIAGAPVGELNFHYAPSEGAYKIKAFYPGTFAKPALSTVELDPAGFISVTEGLLLAKDGTDLILKRCSHENLESAATNGDGTHNVTCDDCDATVKENEACSGGTATCTAKAVCTTCEAEYGQVKDHNMVYTRDANDLTITYGCSDCTHVEVVFTLVIPTGQVYGDPELKTPSIQCSVEGYTGTFPTLAVYDNAGTNELPNAGTYLAEMIMDGSGFGSAYTIAPRPLTQDMVTLSADSGVYGKDGDPTVAVAFGGKALAEGTDYTLTTPTVTNAGTYTYTVTGKGNYTGTVEKTYTLNKATLTAKDFTFTAPTGSYFDGMPKQATVTGPAGCGQITVLYQRRNSTAKTATAPTNWGAYTVYINVAESENYQAVTELTDDAWSFSVNRRSAGEFTVTFDQPDGYDYTGEPIEPGITVTIQLTPDGQPTTLVEGIDYERTYFGHTNVGDGNIILNGKGNYVNGGWNTFKILPVAPTFTAPTAKDLTYNGRAQELVTGGTTEHGTVLYSDAQDGQYSATIPTATKPGDYTVWYYVDGDANHLDTEPAPVTVTVKKAEITLERALTGNYNDYTQNVYVPVYVEGAGDVNGLTITFRIESGEGTVLKTDTATVANGQARVDWLNKLTDGSLLDVGSYNVYASFAGNDYYEATGDVYMDPWTILPYEVIVTVKDQTVTYGEQIASDVEQITASGMPEGYTVTAVTLKPSTTNITSQGTITMSDFTVMAADVDVTHNFGFIANDGVLTIQPDTSAIDNLTVENVTSEDLPAIEEFLEQMENAESTEEEWDDLYDLAEDLKDRIEDAAAMADTDVDGLTQDTVRPETAEEAEDIQGELEAAKEQLERALENFGDNYTDEEEEAIEDELERIEDLLEKLEEVKPFIEAIEDLPEDADPDDEEAIKALLDVIDLGNGISDEARELAGNLDDFQDFFRKLTAYRITLGDGGKYTKDSGKTLSFTANGPAFGQEVYFAALYVDGQRVDAENYTVAAGSTIVELKNAYLETLDVGKHTIYFGYQCAGVAVNSNTAEFEVLVKPALPDGNTGGNTGNDSDSTNPDTGDMADMTLWLGMMAVSTLALASLLLLKKRRNAK